MARSCMDAAASVTAAAGMFFVGLEPCRRRDILPSNPTYSGNALIAYSACRISLTLAFPKFFSKIALIELPR